MTVIALSSQGLVSYLQALLAPIFLGVVGICAVFFLFTKEIIRFFQFVILAILVAVIFYTPAIIENIALALTKALGVH